MDAFSHFRAAYGGGNGEYMLMRPDGYVAGQASKKTVLISIDILGLFCRDSRFTAGLCGIDGTREVLCVRSGNTALRAAFRNPVQYGRRGRCMVTQMLRQGDAISNGCPIQKWFRMKRP